MSSITPAEKCCCNCFSSQAPLEGKLLRCARCKVVFYCSRDCQKNHFPAHKHSCKTIANAYAALREEEVVAMADLNVNYDISGPVKQVMLDIGNMTFQLAYRSCDTPRRGGAMLQVSLGHFLKLLRLKSPILQYPSIRRPDHALLTRIIVLFVALNEDDDAFNMIDYFIRAENDMTDFHDPMAFEWAHFDPAGYTRFSPIGCIGYGGTEAQEAFEAVSGARHYRNATVMVCLILIKMRVLVEHRSDRRGLENFARTSEGIRLTEVHSTIEKYLLRDDCIVSEFEEDLRTLLNHIRDVDPLLMNHIRDTVPLSPEVAGCLFEAKASTDFWHLLQDCFFLSPGVNDILHEYVPDLPFDLET
jgi:hypothetical protein